MQQYYEQRYDDYYDGTGVLNGNNRLERDGTTVYSVTAGDILKARSSAEKNTAEMVELLYGNRTGETIPNSKFLQTTQFSTSGRTSVIEPEVTAYIQSQIAQKTDAGKLQATVEADALAAPEA